MHIPDNFLSTPVWAALDVVAAPAVALISRRARNATDTSRLPLLGVMGAFVFAAQMVNFPVAVGTSGHLVGGTLLACVLGPEAAVLVITCILVVQSLIFQDGGVLALGANIFNMALCGVLAGYLPYSWFRRSRWKYHAVFAGGVLSVLASGLLALAELTLSDIRMPAGLLLISATALPRQCCDGGGDYRHGTSRHRAYEPGTVRRCSGSCDSTARTQYGRAWCDGPGAGLDRTADRLNRAGWSGTPGFARGDCVELAPGDSLAFRRL